MMNESFTQQTVKSQFDVNESVNQLHFAFCGIPTDPYKLLRFMRHLQHLVVQISSGSQNLETSQLSGTRCSSHHLMHTKGPEEPDDVQVTGHGNLTCRAYTITNSVLSDTQKLRFQSSTGN